MLKRRTTVRQCAARRLRVALFALSAFTWGNGHAVAQQSGVNAPVNSNVQDQVIIPFDTLLKNIVNENAPHQITVITWQVLAILIVLLGALALLFYLVFHWNYRADQAGYLGGVYKESVFDFEYNRQTERVKSKNIRGEYFDEASYSNPWIEERPELPRQMWQLLPTSRTTPPGLAPEYGGNVPRPALRIDYPENLDDEHKKALDEYNQKVDDYNLRQKEWHKEINKIAAQTFLEDLAEAKKTAYAMADRAADVDMDVFRGRGPSFVLWQGAIVCS